MNFLDIQTHVSSQLLIWLLLSCLTEKYSACGKQGIQKEDGFFAAIWTPIIREIPKLFLNLTYISFFKLKFPYNCRADSIHQIPQQQFHIFRGGYKSGIFFETPINIQIVRIVQNLLLLLISFSIFENIFLRNYWNGCFYQSFMREVHISKPKLT